MTLAKAYVPEVVDRATVKADVSNRPLPFYTACIVKL